MRKTIAKRLVESKFTAPHFYVTVEIDMDAAVDLREQLQRLEEAKVSFNDLVVKACAKALTRFPMVNASWGGDKIVTHARRPRRDRGRHPRRAHHARRPQRRPQVGLEIAQEVKDLAARARERKLKPEEFTGSTFTISNLGMFDVTEFTAIINPPDSAILAVGAVRKVPVVDGDDIRLGHRMKVTLSSDHRVIDGALAAQFLAEVRRLLEAPVGLAAEASWCETCGVRGGRSRRPRPRCTAGPRRTAARTSRRSPGAGCAPGAAGAGLSQVTTPRRTSCASLPGVASVSVTAWCEAGHLVAGDVGAQHVDVHGERAAGGAVVEGEGAAPDEGHAEHAPGTALGVFTGGLYAGRHRHPPC